MTRISGYLEKIMGDSAPQMMAAVMELKGMMQDEIVHFVFDKVDGTRRHAYGTRAVEVIQRYAVGGDGSAGRPHRAIVGTFPYFDIERRSWRCFKVENLVEIDRNYTL